MAGFYIKPQDFLIELFLKKTNEEDDSLNEYSYALYFNQSKLFEDPLDVSLVNNSMGNYFNLKLFDKLTEEQNFFDTTIIKYLLTNDRFAFLNIPNSNFYYMFMVEGSKWIA